jgi:hypothetical protein
MEVRKMEWIILAMLPLLWMMWRRWRAYEDKREGQGESGDDRLLELIGVIRCLPTIEFEGYEDETKERAESLENRKDELYERLMKKEEETEAVKLLTEDYDRFFEEKREGFHEWESMQQKIEEAIRDHTAFFDETNFYPTDYLFDINRLRQKAEDARTYQLEDPLREREDAEGMVEAFITKIEAFKDVHRRVTELLPALEHYEKTLNAAQQSEYLVKKQALFAHLQQGKLDEVKKQLPYFRAKAKNG